MEVRFDPSAFLGTTTRPSFRMGALGVLGRTAPPPLSHPHPTIALSGPSLPVWPTGPQYSTPPSHCAATKVRSVSRSRTSSFKGGRWSPPRTPIQWPSGDGGGRGGGRGNTIACTRAGSKRGALRDARADSGLIRTRGNESGHLSGNERERGLSGERPNRHHRMPPPSASRYDLASQGFSPPRATSNSGFVPLPQDTPSDS